MNARKLTKYSCQKCMPKIRVYFLGTNGWFTTETGNTVCVLIKTPHYSIICDAGNGLRHLDEYLDPDKPAYLFLSHFHLDHILGLHQINKIPFNKGLKIITFKGGKNILGRFMNQPFTIPLKNLRFNTQIIELAPGRHDKFPFGLQCLDLVHSSRCFGYRFEIDGKVITYCTDTGWCDNLLTLANNADLLIAECALKSGQSDPGWPHLNPEIAAQIAKKAKAKSLALFHFDASVYTTMKERKEAEKKAKKKFSHSFSTYDRMLRTVS